MRGLAGSAGAREITMARNTVLLKIKSLAPSLSAKERKIADFILEDPRLASRLTINELSSSLGIADSTVFKFTRKLGFRGFRDFRTSLLAEEFDPQVSIHENVSETDGPLTVAEKIIHSSAKSLTDTLSLLKESDLELALEYLAEAGTIAFYGCGESGVIALDAYQKFLRSPIEAHCVMDSHMQVMHASQLKEGDVAFVITHTGVTKEMYVVAQLAKEAGARVILITSYPSQRINEYADITFVSTSEETGYRPESLSCRYAMMAIIDSLYTAMMFRLPGTSESLRKIRNAIDMVKGE